MRQQIALRIQNIVLKVIDVKISQISKIKEESYLQINQGYLQALEEMLNELIVVKLKPQQQNRNKIKKQFNSPIFKIELPQNNKVFNNHLLSFGQNSIKIFKIDPIKNKLSTSQVPVKRALNKNSSYTFIDSQNCLIVGGCKTSNPNLKSKQIYMWSTNTHEFSNFSRLKTGVSSHSSLFIYPKLYIVGGNKDFNVVSKYCYFLNILDHSIQQISCLNYPAASFSLCDWKQKYLYKVGGVGECFGTWDLSPYIERYSIQQDYWQVINPKITVNSNLIDSYCLLAHNLSYTTDSNKLIVMGGYNFDKSPSTLAFKILIPQNLQSDHEVKQIGKLTFEGGGFKSNNNFYCNQAQKQMYTIQYTGKGIQKLLFLSDQSYKYLL